VRAADAQRADPLRRRAPSDHRSYSPFTALSRDEQPAAARLPEHPTCHEENEMSHDNILWAEHLERLRRIHGGSSAAPSATTRSAASGDGEARAAVAGEWTARPPGRLGRRLFAEIQPYLDFFATAQS
jgi:hypothetical protein